MLLRYAQHVSEGHGIVWNIGEPPVDGSTDFLDMLAVAGVTRAGLGLETAAKAVGLASHLLCVLVVYAAVRRWTGASPMLALLPAPDLAVRPGLPYVHASYGTTV